MLGQLSSGARSLNFLFEPSIIPIHCVSDQRSSLSFLLYLDILHSVSEQRRFSEPPFILIYCVSEQQRF